MASAPQASAGSLLTIGAAPARPAGASVANTTGSDGAARAGGDFRQLMAEVAGKQTGQKTNLLQILSGAARQPAVQELAASAVGNLLPPDGAPLPDVDDPLALVDDAETEAQATDDENEEVDGGAPAGVLLLNPNLPAQVPTGVGAALVGAAAQASSASGAAVALAPANGATPKPPAAAPTGAPQPEADSERGEAPVDTAAVAVPARGSVPAQDGKPAIDQDFNTLLKHVDQPDAANNAGAHAAGAVEGGRDLATRQYQSAGGATATVQVPVGKPGWSDAVVDKVMWMSAQQLNSAEIHLNPPELGPLQVRISTHHDQASVFFTSQHQGVRDALDQALPKLRDMLDSQGIQLLDAGVGGQGSAQQQAFAWRGDGGGNAASTARAAAGEGGPDNGSPAGNALVAVRASSSLVDAYA